MSSCRKFIKIEILSEEQEAEITTICDWNNWRYELECDTTEGSDNSAVLEPTPPPRDTQNQEEQGNAETIHDRDSLIDLGNKAKNIRQVAAHKIQPESQTGQEHEDEREGECIYCFCLPCVTTYPQAWLGNGQPPRAGNNVIRKKLYRNYWKMLDRRGAWYDPRYLQKERILFQQTFHPDLDESQVIVNSVRRVMPDCVLSQVRALYPNPKKVQYMGHKFE